MDFRFKTVKVGEKYVKLQIWDTAGQERFRTITSAYYRGADGIILVYDVTSRDSFDHVQDWLQEVNRFAAQDTSKLLIGNKCDRQDRKVTTEDGETYANSHNMPFLETSAKASVNVEAAFLAMASELIRNKEAADQGNNRGKETERKSATGLPGSRLGEESNAGGLTACCQ